MRLIEVDQATVFAMFPTIGYATWVNLPSTHVPTHMEVIHGEYAIEISFNYEIDFDKTPKVLKENVTVFLGKHMIGGVALPIRNFYSELRNFIAWLGEARNYLNSESTRCQYKIIITILNRHIDDLFLPPQ